MRRCTYPKIEVSKMCPILDGCNQPKTRLIDIHSAILLSEILRRYNQLNFQQIKYIVSKVSRCPQNWGDIAVVITVAILGYISVALNCIKFLTLSHAFFTLLAPLPQKMKYLGFSSKCIVLCDALILVLRGRGMLLNQIGGYNYIQLSNSLWKYVTQNFYDDV